MIKFIIGAIVGGVATHVGYKIYLANCISKLFGW